MADEQKIYPFTNDEIFKVVMQDESIAKEIISIILGKKVAKIKNYVPQKDKKVLKNAHGVRSTFTSRATTLSMTSRCRICLAWISEGVAGTIRA